MLLGLTKLAVGAATVMTEAAGSEDVTETVENGKKWFEWINENAAKPEVEAIITVLTVAACITVITVLGVKKLLRKKRRN